MNISLVDEMFVTKDNINMVFTDAAVCTYTLDSEAEKTYTPDEILRKDGTYRFKVVDKAGNLSTYLIKKDGTVEYRLVGAGANEVLINGDVTNGKSVHFVPENSDSAYIKRVFHNNKLISYSDDVFTERGKWELIVADKCGNESYCRFYILSGKLDGFTYSTPYSYVITSVKWELDTSVAEATEAIKEGGLLLEATENGTYTVTMQSIITQETKTFTFTIDKTPPRVELVGCKKNEKTINNVTLKGCSIGDTVFVYKDGALVQTVRIDSEKAKPPTISQSGKYRIVVENEAKVKTVLNFERKYIANKAGSILIIILALASVAGLMVSLAWRNHSKTDE
jgi:hypothetical protein